MLRKLGLMTMFAAGLAAVVAAADLNGRWEAKIAGPDGDFDLVFTFSVDGERLGGTVDGPGGTLQISNGTIKGDAIAFDVKLEGDATITHEGTVKGDEIAMKSKGPWGESEFTLKRAAKKQ